MWRTLPFYVAAILLVATIDFLDGPSWVNPVLFIAPLAVWSFFLEQGREGQ